jgi:Outer membrane lipoprotein carrier protein LolA-like
MEASGARGLAAFVVALACGTFSVPAVYAIAAGEVARASEAARAAGAPASSATLDRLMSLLAERKHGHVTFVEEHFLAVLDRPVESSGELFYDAPDRLEKRTLKPKPESLVLEHGVITAHRGRRTYMLNLSDYPQIVPLIDSIRATLAGDRAALERIFEVTLEGDLEQWKLLLVPSDPTVAKTVKQIRIAGDRDAIHSVEIQQADGDRSLLTIGPEVVQ